MSLKASVILIGLLAPAPLLATKTQKLKPYIQDGMPSTRQRAWSDNALEAQGCTGNHSSQALPAHHPPDQ